ncbi:unnamed protein product [Rhizoctonia solani]|uniref:Uncharacterized protein n=1 Tax=Rhizoctonia solani TaxID=456999 RepID=A0A8H3G9S7_9AGAM|nr:unnamed protein product [Rhizoctonia solani]
MTLILHSIAPGSYRTVVNLTQQSHLYGPGGSASGPETEALALQLEGINIDILVLDRSTITNHDLRLILRAMPTIQTLYILERSIGSKTSQNLVRPIESSVGSDNVRFPKIHTLYLWDCYLNARDDPNLDKFKEMVISHGIQELGLRGGMATPMLVQSSPIVLFDDPEADQYTTPIKEWLRDNVPQFKMIKELNDLPHYNRQEKFWQLW